MTEEHGINPIAFAVPLFLASILIEAAIAKRQGRQGYYFFGTALADVTSGTVFQVLEVFFKFVPLLVYAWVVERYALIDWGESTWGLFFTALLLVDFMYYWWHRESHVINLLWAVHGVHHQSEDFNLAVALRQPIFEPITWFFFYIPLALLGIPVEVFLAAYALDLLYQFFIHTELVRKLPAPIEWVFNTPSHHRVHHGVQDQYLDKNYGGILVIWDRMFGTFEAEDERVIYGTTVPVHSYNPLWTNFNYFQHMASLARQATRLRDKLWVWFAHPAWLPQGVERDANELKRLKSDKYRPEVAPELVWYLSGHYLLLGALILVFLMFEASFGWGQRAAGCTAIVMSTVVFLGLVEGKRWAEWMELARGPVVAGAVVWLAALWLQGWVLVGIGALVLVVMWGSWNVWRARVRGAGAA
ncbi:sterol desaturase family protein [Enhygromyxa salina]|nr:sterol desaturase family protein [Enhygromyxa salina]